MSGQGISLGLVLRAPQWDSPEHNIEDIICLFHISACSVLVWLYGRFLRPIENASVHALVDARGLLRDNIARRRDSVGGRLAHHTAWDVFSVHCEIAGGHVRVMLAVKLFGQVVGASLESILVIVRTDQLCGVIFGLFLLGLLIVGREGIVGMQEEEDDQERDKGETTQDVYEEEPLY